MPKPKGTPNMATRHKHRGNGLTLPEKEAMYQAYLALGSKVAVCRSLGVSKSTLREVLKEFDSKLTPAEQKERQAAVTDHLAGHFFNNTMHILDSIKPEDLESGRLPIKDSQGNITGYKEYGPSLLQKATAAGIFTDKISILRKLERDTAQEQQSGQLLMPEGVTALLQGVKRQIKSIQVLNVNFREDNPELATRLDAAMQVAAVDADGTDGGDTGPDFYNP